MVMPVRQRCPECGNEFMGSDCLGMPCDDCRNFEAIEKARQAIKKLRECWYVTVECAGKKLVGIGPNELAGKSDLSKEEEDIIREAAEHLLAFVGENRGAPLLEGRRCPKCQSLMIHTRLGGYRCNRGCQ
jgi:predicted Zn-ribbon and HTH transcriptional regulator